MREWVEVTGMVLQAGPMGEYDRRVVLLTKERGRITAFAKGARKVNSRLLAATNPFSFGNFTLYEGRNTYTMRDAEISNYFQELRANFEGAYYGMYFMELAQYYTRENVDETKMLKLLYQSLRALLNKTIDNELVRYIYEIKAMVINGEFPGVPKHLDVDPSTTYTFEFVESSPIEKLYTFTVSEKVMTEIKAYMDKCKEKYVDKKMKSLEILENCRLKN